MTQEKRIDFNKLSKPANLQNSAVLKMLEEEEERKRLGKPGLRRVEWPPTKEGSLDYVDFVEQNPVQSKTRGSGEYATYQSKSPTQREGSSAPKPNHQASLQQPPHSQERPSPGSCSPGTPRPGQRSQEHVIPISSGRESEAPEPSSPLRTANEPRSWAPVAPPCPRPAHQRQQQPQPPQEHVVPVSCAWRSGAPASRQAGEPTGWGSAQPREHVVPVSCPWKSESSPSCGGPGPGAWEPRARPQVQIRIKQTPPTPPPDARSGPGWSAGPQRHSLTVGQEVQSPRSHHKPQSSAAPFEPPATLITLRQEPPISQEPSPVYYSQPAATEAGYDGSSMGRGDNKWPPAVVKEQTEAENRARIELAKGPACRPRKVHKDYSSFFAQHAVTNNYPGYRAPPGTQYFTPAYQQ